MSRSTARELYTASLDTPLFHLEDIFITGILASKVNIRWIDFKYFILSINFGSFEL